MWSKSQYVCDVIYEWISNWANQLHINPVHLVQAIMKWHLSPYYLWFGLMFRDALNRFKRNSCLIIDMY